VPHFRVRRHSEDTSGCGALFALRRAGALSPAAHWRPLTVEMTRATPGFTSVWLGTRRTAYALLSPPWLARLTQASRQLPLQPAVGVTGARLAFNQSGVGGPPLRPNQEKPALLLRFRTRSGRAVAPPILCAALRLHPPILTDISPDPIEGSRTFTASVTIDTNVRPIGVLPELRQLHFP